MKCRTNQDSGFQDSNILKCSRTQEFSVEISESRHRSAGLPTAPTARRCPCPITRSHAAHDAPPVAASRGWRSQRPHAAGGRRPRPATLLCRPWPTPTPAAADRGSPRHPLLHLAAAALPLSALAATGRGFPADAASGGDVSQQWTRANGL